MNFNSLRIGNLEAKVPIIQGGMGIGISLSNLSGTVAKEGGIGIISTAQIGYMEDDFESNTLEANLRALKKHIEKAREIAPNGIIGINIMVATKHYEEHIKVAIESGINLIISGAGIPKNLPKLVKGYDVKIVPIVSSLKAAKLILKLWDTKYNVIPDAIVVEGPKAGGHLGFNKTELENVDNIRFDECVKDIINFKKEYEEKYKKHISIIPAGGIYDGNDIAKYLKMGADGVQMGTRFVATEECDAHKNFKMAYVNCKKENINIVKSPVGMPGRAIINPFIKKVKNEKEVIKKCYDCLIPCNPSTTDYCITKALIESAKGNVDSGLLFCGENAYKIKEISTVKNIINEVLREIENS
ncbi:NAD(P)H-dependent flavin oxidoreductase [Clostridium ihumii]|uniref:NAD(P)H-dependent flavin oxidoreductase n=1 Tax=Clostridium ihumii TaxID=1470356 RepID=UPI003D35686E